MEEISASDQYQIQLVGLSNLFMGCEGGISAFAEFALLFGNIRQQCSEEREQLFDGEFLF